MFPKFRLFAFLIVFLLMVSSCSSNDQVSLLAADNGSQVNIKVGGLIVITLDGNPSTGYSWEAKDLDTSSFEQIGDPVFNSSNPGLVGSGGTLTLTFKTLITGTSTLTLVYHRPWEKTIDPLDIFEVTVNAK